MEKILKGEITLASASVGVGVIAFAVLVIVIYFLRRRRKKSARSEQQEETDDGVAAPERFADFVLSLFDPLYFSLRKNPITRRFSQSYLFDFAQGEMKQSVLVILIYHGEVRREVLQCSPDMLKEVRSLKQEHNIETYFVLGFSGEPDSPREVYLVPSGEVKGNTMLFENLRPFRKHGMFFWSGRESRLK